MPQTARDPIPFQRPWTKTNQYEGTTIYNISSSIMYIPKNQFETSGQGLNILGNIKMSRGTDARINSFLSSALSRKTIAPYLKG
jgi:hypothetical protein